MRVILKFVDPDGRICDEVDEATKLRVAMRWTEATWCYYYPALVVPLEPAKNAVEHHNATVPIFPSLKS